MMSYVKYLLRCYGSYLRQEFPSVPGNHFHSLNHKLHCLLAHEVGEGDTGDARFKSLSHLLRVVGTFHDVLLGQRLIYSQHNLRMKEGERKERGRREEGERVEGETRSRYARGIYDISEKQNCDSLCPC